MPRIARRLSIALLGAVALGLSLAPVSEARQLERQSVTANLPSVSLSGEMRRSERVARVSVRTAPGVRLEAVVNIGCVNLKTGSGKSKHRTFKATGRLSARIRRPRGRGLTCFASTVVKVPRRSASNPGDPQPVTLGAALYAQRR